MLSFLLSWSPYAVVALTNSFADPRSFPFGRHFGLWIDCLAPIFAKTSSCFSAAAFIISNKRYRQALISILPFSSKVRWEWGEVSGGGFYTRNNSGNSPARIERHCSCYSGVRQKLGKPEGITNPMGRDVNLRN